MREKAWVIVLWQRPAVLCTAFFVAVSVMQAKFICMHHAVMLHFFLL